MQRRIATRHQHRIHGAPHNRYRPETILTGPYHQRAFPRHWPVHLPLLRATTGMIWSSSGCSFAGRSIRFRVCCKRPKLPTLHRDTPSSCMKPASNQSSRSQLSAATSAPSTTQRQATMPCSPVVPRFKRKLDSEEESQTNNQGPARPQYQRPSEKTAAMPREAAWTVASRNRALVEEFLIQSPDGVNWLQCILRGARMKHHSDPLQLAHVLTPHCFLRYVDPRTNVLTSVKETESDKHAILNIYNIVIDSMVSPSTETSEGIFCYCSKCGTRIEKGPGSQNLFVHLCSCVGAERLMANLQTKLVVLGRLATGGRGLRPPVAQATV